ncbi:hypothetical protein HJFPF1_13085 [Paramyrothecium foliicola]|nr:hypothetical protein HJFPF1_13085 [Paramyrothecium foliicola]
MFIHSHLQTSGMLLTLDLCLLAQPYGSLLFPQPQTLFGQVVFFFWRLNSVTAATEAMIVMLLLLYVWFTSRGARSPGSWFRHGVGAILLLRSDAHWMKTRSSEQPTGIEMFAPV